jgi:polysaccharide deacetylase family protein (PEP-CTERM system associated)
VNAAAGAPVNALTVDLEDWYQGLEIDVSAWGRFEDRLRVGTGRLLDLFGEAGVRATFFVLGWAAEKDPELIRLIHARGHEIGTHGYSHQFVYQLGEEGFRRDLGRSLEILDRVLGAPVLGHRAPFFSITRQSMWAFDVLREFGIAYDSSVFPVRNYRYGIPDAPRWIHPPGPDLLEFPISTRRLLGRNLPLGGGAYFRLFPYTFIRRGFQQINASGRPAVFYIHPWELDPDHPRLDLPWRISLTHYWNLSGSRRRLQRLLREFRFTTMREVLDLENRAAVPRKSDG